MTYAEFLKSFEPTMSAFGHQKFSGAVLERIQKKLFDFKPVEIHQLNELVIDHCERVPTVSKITELANIVRSKRPAKADNYTFKLNCNSCKDMGLIMVTLLDGSIQQLMRCTCVEGTNYRGFNTQLPQFDEDYATLFTPSVIPNDWFKPEGWKTGQEVKRTAQNFKQKVEQWKERVIESEKYWLKHMPDLGK